MEHSEQLLKDLVQQITVVLARLDDLSERDFAERLVPLF